MPYQSWEEVQGMLRIDAVMLAAEQPRNCLPVAAVGRTALLRLVLHVALASPNTPAQHCERHQHSRMYPCSLPSHGSLEQAARPGSSNIQARRDQAIENGLVAATTQASPCVRIQQCQDCACQRACLDE